MDQKSGPTQSLIKSNVETTTYRAEFKADYAALNQEWIETYFKIEPMDIAQLEDPEGKILEKGGEIFFILENGKPVGTCAMVPHGPGCFELAKMAVDRCGRGKGYGDLLMKTALAWARTQKAKSVILLSNTILEPAITLYKKHGFQTVHLGRHPDYERCNIEMHLHL